MFENGIAKLLANMESQGLGNIRIFADDALLLLDRLAARTIGRVFILFPDPWPKERHKKRRIVSRETLDCLARAMRPGRSCGSRPTIPITRRGWKSGWDRRMNSLA